MRAEFTSSIQKKQTVEAGPDALSNMAQLIELIVMARYGMPEDRMGFETDASRGHIQMVFGPLGAFYETVDDLRDGDPVFFFGMKNFLSDLQDASASPSLDIDPINMGIAAGSKMDLFDALKSFVDDEARKLSTMDNVNILSEKEEKSFSSDKISARIHDLAGGCDRMAAKNQEAYEYLILNAPIKPYLSLEHYKASLTVRVGVDIPMFVDSIKHQILIEECQGEGKAVVKTLAKHGIYYH